MPNFFNQPPNISGPTNVTNGPAGQHLKKILANGDLDATTKKVLTAALMSVGTLFWGKDDSPRLEWGAPNAKVPQGVNCWTAVVYWAFMGGAFNAGELQEYIAGIANGFKDGGNTGKDPVFEKHLRYRHATTLAAENPTPGSTVFFSVPQRPLSHVAMALGGNQVVSCWAVRSHPACLDRPELAEGATHIIDIETLKDICGGAQCTVKATPAGYWTLPE